MSDIIEEKGKVLSFTLLKIEKGREKICKCNPPHYEIDTVNRIVTCTDCGATLDAFEALLKVYEYQSKWEEYQKKALEKAKIYGEMADEEFHRRMKNKAFKDMDSHYHNGLYPICPKCREIINPMEIKEYANEKYYDNEDNYKESDTQ